MRLLSLVQMDSMLKILCQIPHGCISCKELLQISMDSMSEDNCKEVVKSLDEAWQILIIGNRVYLRPEQVPGAIFELLKLLLLKDFLILLGFQDLLFCDMFSCCFLRSVVTFTYKTTYNACISRSS